MGPNPQETADLDTFTEEIHNENRHFLCSDPIYVLCLEDKVNNYFYDFSLKPSKVVVID